MRKTDKMVCKIKLKHFNKKKKKGGEEIEKIT